MYAGFHFLGKIDTVGTESIRTRFLFVGIPLFPVGSYYVLRETRRSIISFRIRPNVRSIVAGYARIPSAIVAVAGSMWFCSQGGSTSIFVSAAAVLLWLASLLGIGRLSEAEVQRRCARASVIGHAAEPRVVTTAKWQEVDAQLRTKLADEGLPSSPEELNRQAEHLDASQLAIVHAYASWQAGKTTPEASRWSDLARLTWQRLAPLPLGGGSAAG